MAFWLRENDKDSDIAVSTRARLARNVAKTPFPHKIRGTARVSEIKAPVKDAFLVSGSDFSFLELADLSAIEKTRLVEKHIISKELTNYADSAVLLSPDETVSIMIMEEDHYRLQCITSGFNPEVTYGSCNELAKLLGKKVDYAFDEKMGYLTACPTNVGSGLRVSVMLHLKGLALSDTVSSVLSSLGRFGVTARGLYGEGSAAGADMYQISNQITLGVAEEEIVKNLQSVVQSVIENEREVRKILYRNNKLELDDRVMRAYGTLKYAKKIDTNEALGHLSMLNFGMGLGLVEPCTQSELYNLMMDIMPGTLSGENIDASMRDTLRAQRIQNVIE